MGLDGHPLLRLDQHNWKHQNTCDGYQDLFIQFQSRSIESFPKVNDFEGPAIWFFGHKYPVRFENFARISEPGYLNKKKRV